MGTFAALKTRIADELNRDDLTSQINLAVLTAVEHYKYKRFWFNEATLTSDTADGVEYQAYPTSGAQTLLSIDSLKVTQSGSAYILREESFDTIERWTQGAQSESCPHSYADYKTKARLYPVPDAVYTLTWAGLVDLGTLSLDADTNAWTTEAEALIRQRAKAIVKLDLTNNPLAQQEAALLMSRGEDFLSVMERSAYAPLRAQTIKRTTTGRLKAHAC